MRIVVGDSNDRLAAAVHNALGEQGFSTIERVTSVDSFVNAVQSGFLDLIVFDAHLPGGQASEIVQRMRRRGIGENPYAGVIATIRDTAGPMTRQVVDSGADAVVVKPLTVETLFESVSSLVKGRKQFVVTHDYVGPTRRATVRPGDTTIAVQDPPNSLRCRLVYNMSDQEVKTLVNQAATRLLEDQFDAVAKEIDRLVTYIAEHEVLGADEQAVQDCFERLDRLAQNLRRRHSGTASQPVADLASMLNVLGQRAGVKARGTRTVEIELLVNVNLAIRRALSVEHTSSGAISQINAMISRFTEKKS